MKTSANVVIVGRTNVGKSSLFNRISDSVKSIVLDYHGVTRDPLKTQISWNSANFNCIDTGGIVFKTADFLEIAVNKKIFEAIESAALILFVLDVQVGITKADLEIANFLRKNKKQVFVLLNKFDSAAFEADFYEFYKLGFTSIFRISAQHGSGIADLLDAVATFISNANLQNLEQLVDFKITLLGKPNSGKSSLMNLLLKKNIAIVSNVPGTTREANRQNLNFNEKSFELIDTAGVRRGKAIDTELETLMIKNSLNAAKRSNLILLLVDLESAMLTTQDLKLVTFAFESGAAVLILFNKFDLLDSDDKRAKFEASCDEYKFLLKKFETLNISCLDEKNIGKIFPKIETVLEKYNSRFSENQLTQLFFEALHKTPLYKIRQRLNFYSAKQISTAPIRIELTVENKELFGDSELLFFENVLRKKVDLKSVPLFFYLKNK